MGALGADAAGLADHSTVPRGDTNPPRSDATVYGDGAFTSLDSGAPGEADASRFAPPNFADSAITQGHADAAVDPPPPVEMPPEPPASICDNYPPTNGLIEAGNPIRNYTFVDKTGATRQLCELSDGTNRFAYLVYSSLTCGYCQEEAHHFEAFQRANAANGVVVVEAIVDAVAVAQLNAWPGSAYDYDLIAVQPDPNLPQIDCTNTPACDSGYTPHHMLIDLTTMRVLEPNCTHAEAIRAYDRSYWQACIDRHL